MRRRAASGSSCASGRSISAPPSSARSARTEKAQIAQAHGCDHTILYREVDFVDAVRKIVPAGVAAVFDGVGKDTFVPSLDCVRPFGMLVNYGNASGHPPPIDLLHLAKRGSLSVSRPALSSLTADVAAHARGRRRAVRSRRNAAP